ncbi:YciI family protein [Streptomyces sp. NPDC058193]|uniref:YciI family protein n=1 Tax=Streptomyces sp. NPDC058193 TaxID=3346373 RepID=UPI0036EEEAF0
MFLLLNTYTVPTKAIDEALPRHRRWVEHHFAENHFIFGGRREPRTGGFVIAASDDEAEVRGYLEDEPLFAEGLVTWEIVGLVAQLAVDRPLSDALNALGVTTSVPGNDDNEKESSETVRVVVNDEDRELPGASTVELLVTEMCQNHGVDREAVSVSLDGEVLPQERWAVPLGAGTDIRLAVLTPGG